MNGPDPVHTWLEPIERKTLRIGGIALAASLVACLVGIFWPAAAPLLLGSYLIGYLFVLGWALGSMGLLMLHHVAGGMWGATLRRALEAGTRTMPAVSVLFLPILFGSYSLYEWAHPGGHDHLIAEKRAYLNLPFFTVRAIIYFAVWNVLARVLNRWAREQETSTSPRLARRFRLLSGPGLVLYGLTMTFAAFDWAMSLTPHWYSTIYGVMLIVGQGLNALALTVAVSIVIARRKGSLGVVPADILADLGSLLLAFVMLWAYMSVSQLLIIWSANIPEEITWYLPRLRGGWGLVGLLLVVFHFFVPFFALLQGRLKRDPQRLLQLAVLLIAMRLVDLFWVVGASLHVHGAWTLLLILMVAVAAVGLSGVWLSFFARQLRARSLSPYPMPALEAPEADAGVSP